jgi:hypothetical protein
MRHDTAGDPITGLKWTRKTTKKLAAELAQYRIHISPKTVGRLLKGLDFRLRANFKALESGNRKPPDPRKRDEQFRYIKSRRIEFGRRDNPVISVDSKKKELIGNFKNPGRSWQFKPIRVNDHDFHIDAEGWAIPYGIYDDQQNRGYVFIGTSYETPAFAVDSIVQWWCRVGRERYPQARELLILADCGGANGYRSRVWKYRLYRQLCEPYNLSVTVCHYPPGASKWNPIEHLLFSEISKNWSGQPLTSYETLMKYIRTTRTEAGLTVDAHLVNIVYEKGESVSNAQIATIPLVKNDSLPDWNYIIQSHRM